MNKKVLFPIWGGLFILCAGLGFIPEPAGAVQVLLTALSVAFFLPPALLVYGAVQAKDKHTLMLVRNLSALSLILTLVLLIVNLVTALASEALGNFLYAVLVIVSSPMICCGHWALSMFLWACLLLVCMQQLRKK